MLNSFTFLTNGVVAWSWLPLPIWAPNSIGKWSGVELVSSIHLNISSSMAIGVYETPQICRSWSTSRVCPFSITTYPSCCLSLTNSGSQTLLVSFCPIPPVGQPMRPVSVNGPPATLNCPLVWLIWPLMENMASMKPNSGWFAQLLLVYLIWIWNLTIR